MEGHPTARARVQGPSIGGASSKPIPPNAQGSLIKWLVGGLLAGFLAIFHGPLFLLSLYVERHYDSKKDPTLSLATSQRELQKHIQKFQKRVKTRDELISKIHKSILYQFVCCIVAVLCCYISPYVFSIFFQIFSWILSLLDAPFQTRTLLASALGNWTLFSDQMDAYSLGDQLGQVATSALLWVFSIAARLLFLFYPQDISALASAYQQQLGKTMATSSHSLAAQQTSTYRRLLAFMADFLYSLFLESIFLVQASAMFMIPIGIVAHSLYAFHISLLYSLYAFENRWFDSGVTIKERVGRVEQHWPFFVCFGLLPFLLSIEIPQRLWTSGFLQLSPISYLLFSFLFPLMILSAVHAERVQSYLPKGDAALAASAGRTFVFRIFLPSTVVVDLVIKLLHQIVWRRNPLPPPPTSQSAQVKR